MHNAESSSVSVCAQILDLYGSSSHQTPHMLPGTVPECLPLLRAVDAVQADFDLSVSFSKHGDGVPVSDMDDLAGEGVGRGGAEDKGE